MNNKGVGTVFCLISALLISANYISAAVFMSSVPSWSSDLFNAGLEYVGPFLSIASFCALVVGVLFLGYEIYKDIKENKKKSNTNVQ